MDSALPALTESTTIDCYSEPGFSLVTESPVIVLTGTNAGPGSDGLDVDADDVAILGMVINGFSGDGINIASNDNAVEDCIVGVAGNYSTPVPDNVGIYVTGADNLIGADGQGGSYAAQVLGGNWFAHSVQAGIWLSGPGATGNVVAWDSVFDNGPAGVLIDASASGNWIGVNTVDGGESPYDYNFIGHSTGAGVVISGAGTTGNVVAGNAIRSNGTDGVLIEDGASGNWIGVNPQDGSETALQRNVISGNTNDGVEISGAGTTANVVAGNFIGTDVAGTTALGNGEYGVWIHSAASANTIGGSDATARNVISGNRLDGVFITDAGTNANVVAADFIGLNAAGNAAVPNGNGIEVYNGPTDTQIGPDPNSPDPLERNVLSGNNGTNNNNGVLVFLAGPGTVIAGNFIGTDATGTFGIGNGPTAAEGGDGVCVEGNGSAGVTIGGTVAGAGNVLSANYEGIFITDDTLGVSDVLIEGNLIGTNASGTGAIPNTSFGIQIGNAASSHPLTAITIGGTTAAAMNLISGNGGAGIEFDGASTYGNLVEGNFIGTNLAGNAAIANDGPGVLIVASPSYGGSGPPTDNTIGGDVTGAGNLISGNTGDGVEISGSGTAGNVVAGNLIGTDVTGTIAIANYAGVEIDSGGSGNLIGASGNSSVTDPLERNIISGNSLAGVWITGTGSDNNVVAGNYIGTTVSGDSALGNGTTYLPAGAAGVGGGVIIEEGASDNLVGTTGHSADDAGERNIISGSLEDGVDVYDAPDTVIAGNYIGTDPTGTIAIPNANNCDIAFINASSGWVGLNSVYGAPDADQNNVISASGYFGVAIFQSSGITVAGNLIGTDVTGKVALGNDGDGVAIYFGSSGNTIGGTAAGAGNVISGNAVYGVWISGAGTTGNVVVGNFIGTNAAGTEAVPNGNAGVELDSSTSGNTIGGTAAALRNIISGNAEQGVLLNGSGVTGNVVEGNYIGTDVTGTVAIANSGAGVKLEGGAANNTIGGTTAGAGNLVSGGASYGIRITGAGSTGNVVAGNLIGTNSSGESALPNALDGVYIDSAASGNTIGGTASGARNVISGNTDDGIEINGTGTTGNVVAGNLIGTDATGTVAIPNYAGVEIDSGASGNLIGASGTSGVTDPLERNILSGNKFAGVWLTGTGTDNNVVSGNYIGTTVSGDAALGNGSVYIDITHAQGWVFTASGGVEISYGASDNLIGTTGHSADDAGQRNVISGTDDDNVNIYGSGTSNNVVAGNYIGTNPAGSAALPNAGWGILIALVSSGWVGVNPVYGSEDADQANVISGNDLGMQILDSSSVVVAGNLIGTDVSGMVAVPNTLGGVVISDSSVSNLIGTTGQDGADDALERNVIAGNDGPGVVLGTIYLGGVPGTVTQNVVAGNFIGTNAAGTAALGNTIGVEIISNASYAGIQLPVDASGNWIGVNSVYGAQNADQANLISGNTSNGVDISGAGTTGNVVAGDLIGTNAAGEGALGNGYNGIEIHAGAAQNTIGGTVTGARNVVSGNTGAGTYFGIYLTDAGTDDNVIVGNYVGTDLAGTVALGNGEGGILVDNSASANTIGGTSAADRNLVSGNSLVGIAFASSTMNNIAQGNWVGLNASGTGTIANGVGIGFINGASAGDAAINNVISGNQSAGVFIGPYNTTGFHESDILVEGNLIGTDPTGTIALGNSGPGVEIGAYSSGNTIGGSAPGAGNLISNNAGAGVSISGTTSEGNVVLGNEIGTDLAGTVAMANSGDGVLITGGATNNTIGGITATPGSGAGNLISGNTHNGVEILDAGTTGNVVAGNLIGTDVTGEAALANSNDGVGIASGASNNTIGGTSSGSRNVVSGNGNNGVEINGTGTTGNLVAGNLIGTDATGEVALPNGQPSAPNEDGVEIDNGASNNTIGGSDAGDGNVISGNASDGVYVYFASSNTIAGNLIGTDVAGTTALENGSIGIEVVVGGYNIIGMPGAGNVVSGGLINNNAIGVLFSTGTVVQANRIGTTADGMAVLPGQALDGGIGIWNSVDTLIGGTEPGTGNVIALGPWQSALAAYNEPVGGFPWIGGAIGVLSTGSATASAGTLIESNLIGTNASGTAALGDPTYGIVIVNSSEVTIGGTAAGAANVIVGSGAGGIAILGGVVPAFGSAGQTDYGSSDDLIEGNLIGVNFDSNGNLIPGLGNGGPLPGLTGGTEAGILINDPTDALQTSSGNTIGGTAAGAANIISGNQGGGIVFTGGSVTANLVEGNFIGTNLQGNAAVANSGDGVQITGGATNNTIGGTTAGAGNVIAFNLGVGVQIGGNTTDASTGNAILANSIFANLTLGIALGGTSVVQNDSEGHTGPNLFQDFPVISSVMTAGSTTTIDGTISEAANTTYRIELFSNFAADPSGDGQGELFLTFVNVMTDGSGTGSFSVTAPSTLVAGTYVSATATDAAGNTSEFSADTVVTTAGASYAVTTTVDSGTGSLRAAIEAADASSGDFTIIFDIPSSDPGYDSSTSTWTISLQSALPAVTQSVTINGYSQPGWGPAQGYNPAIVLNGSTAGEGADGLDLAGGGQITVLALYFNDFSGAGLDVESSGNTIQDSGFGIAPNFSTPEPDAVGILVTGADNLIGTNGQAGAFPDQLADNFFENVLGPAVWMDGPSATGNVLAGDYIGPSDQDGVLISNGASANWVGVNTVYGPESADDRVDIISNAAAGVEISGIGTTGNVVAGNTIESSGTDGVLIDDGATGNWIGVNPQDGARTALQRNVISGNTDAGVEITGTGTTGNTVAGNYVGTNSAGAAADANDFGVEIDSGASGNLIGASGASSTSDALERNVISANTYEGVLITGTGSDLNVVAGNYIGTTANGQSTLGNGSRLYISDQFDAGIAGGVAIIDGASNNLIGTSGQSADDAGERNLISGNLADGVDIYGSGTSDNAVAGNLIGTNAAGTAPLANEGDGVYFAEVNATNWIGVNSIYGPENADQGNIISDNLSGMQIFDSTGEVVAGNLIEGNSPGSNGFGIQIVDSSNNLIGTSGQDGADDALERNVISGNSGAGVWILTHAYGVLTNPSATNNVVAGNYIGTNTAGTAALSNGGDGVEIQGASDNWIGVNSVYGPESADQRNVISGNAVNAVFITGAGTNGNTIAGNFIGLNAAGNAAVPNNNGIRIDTGATNTLVGTDPNNPNPLERNVISGNPNTGVWVRNEDPGTVVAGNYIGTDATGTIGIGNGPQVDGAGVFLEGDASGGVTVGGTVAGAGNLISANAVGVWITDSGTLGTSDAP